MQNGHNNNHGPVRVVITGVGAITPLGNDLPTTWANLLAGKSGVDIVQGFDTSQTKSKLAAQVKGFDPTQYMDRKDARRMDRFIQFAVATSKQAVADAKLDMSQEDPEQCGVVLGSAIGGLVTILEQHNIMLSQGAHRVSPFTIPAILIDSAPGQVSILLGMRGPNFGVVSACATGGGAIGEAFEIIRRGDATVMLTGGAEAGLTPLSFAGFDNINALSTHNDEPQKACRPFDKTRDGFIAGEGGGALLLETLDHALARGAHIYAEIIGYGVSADAHHLVAPLEDGSGAVSAIRMALRKAEQYGVRPEDIGYINAHGTSTALNDRSETAAIKAVFGEQAYQIPISSTKSMTGHLLGAAGAVEAIFTAKSLQEQIVPPTINYEHPDPECDLDYVPNQARTLPGLKAAMSDSFGFGGHNTCLILRRYEGE